MFINGMEIDQTTGRAIISQGPLAVGALGNGGFMYDPAGNVLQTVNAAGPLWAVNGFGIAADTRQDIKSVPPSGDDIRINGARVDSAEGRMSVSTIAPIAFYNQGWPFSAAGELCIN